MQLLKEHKGFYYIADMEVLAENQSVVQYLDNTQDIEDVSAFLRKILPDFLLQTINLLDEELSWSVYLLNSN